jgi:hypothetical protein
MLVVPPLLEEMLATGWPRNVAEAGAQKRVAKERVRRLVPEESTIYLLPPPFLTVRERSKSNPQWMRPEGAPDGIDFDLALDIADFGLGSDAPILLDYRQNPNPRAFRVGFDLERSRGASLTITIDLSSLPGNGRTKRPLPAGPVLGSVSG